MCYPKCAADQQGYLSWCLDKCPASYPYDCMFFCSKNKYSCGSALNNVDAALKGTGETLGPCIEAITSAIDGKFSLDWFKCAAKMWSILSDTSMALLGLSQCEA